MSSHQIELQKSSQWLFYCIMAYFIMNGAQLWETFILVPAWTAAPPASLHFFKGPHGIDLKLFWIVVHSVHDVFFIVAVVVNWGNKYRRIPLLLLFVAHMAVRAWTLAYFAPAIMWFQSLPASEEVDPALITKAAMWRNLNYLRVTFFIVINVLLVLLLKDPKKLNHD